VIEEIRRVSITDDLLENPRRSPDAESGDQATARDETMGQLDDTIG
jgi:hypothetical protein